MISIRLFVLLIALLFARPAGAAQYFVDPAGADTNDGSARSPFATIQHALDLAQPGDTITIGEGTYPESVQVSGGGAAGSPIRIVASGAVALVPPGGASSAGLGIDGSYLEVTGIDIAGFDTGIAIAQGSTDIALSELAVHDNGTGIFIDRAAAVLLRDSDVSGNCTHGVRAVGSSRNLTFARVTASGNGIACGLAGDGFYVAAEAADVVLEDCRAEGNSGDGFDTRSNRTTLRRVVSLGNGDHGMRLERNATVEVSLVANNVKVGLEISGTRPATLSVVASTIAGQPLALLLGPAGQAVSASLLGNVLTSSGKVIEYQETVALTEDYDLIFRPSPGLPHIVRKLGSATTASYSGNDITGGLWASASGQGTHSLAADPLFIGAGSVPFGLKAASAAIDSGPPAGVPAADLLGVPRPSGSGTDMGAFERQGGAAFYVSPAGDDSGPGTAAAPFLTIGHAAAVAGAGDTVIIRAGDYREAVNLAVSGLPGASIDFFAEPGANLNSPLPDPVNGPDAVTVAPGVGFVTLSGLRIAGGFRRGIYVRAGAHDVSVAGIEATGNGTGVLVEGGSDVLLDGIYSHDNCGHGIAATLGSRAIAVRDSASERNGACASQGDGFYSDENSGDITVEGSSASSNNGDGFDFRGSGVEVKRSLATSNGKVGFKFVGGGVVENCVGAANATVGLELTGEAPGADLRIASSTFATNSIGVLLGSARAPATVTMVNNIIEGSGKLLEFQDTVSLVEDYDLFFRDLPSLPHIMKKQGGTQVAAYTASDINGGVWAGAGGGSHSQAADPRFLRRGPQPYQIKLDSPALDSGLASAAPATDIDGISRPQLAGVDRGAYERPEGFSSTYYVAPDGSDSGNGDSLSPFRSVNVALAFAGPGDSVILRPGTYQEEVAVSGSGMPGAEIVLVGEGGEAIVQGAGQGTGLTVTNGASYLQVVGLTIEGFTTGVLVDAGSHHVTLGQLEVRRSGAVGVEIDGGSQVLIEDSRVGDNCGHGIDIATGSADVTVSGTESYRNGASCASSSDGFHVASLASGASFSRCRAAGNTGDGFDARGSGMFLSRVEAWDNGDRGIKVERSAEVETALLVRNKVGLELTGTFAGGSLELRNSTVFGDGSYGLLVGAGRQPVSATLVNNIVAGSPKSLEYQVTATISEHHNIFYRTTTSSSHIVVKDGGSTVAQFAASGINDGSWSAYSGQGRSTRAADPLLAAPDLGDFSLRRLSPAVDSGDDSAAPSVDLLGRTRPLGLAVDMGAIERPPPTSLYVAPDGSDQNPGTTAAPFATLQRAADLTGPGYEVVIRSGTYRQTLAIRESGAPGSPVSFRFEPGARLLPPGGSQAAVTVSSGVGYVEIAEVAIDPGFAQGILAQAGSHDLSIVNPEVAGAGSGIVLEGAANVSIAGGVTRENCGQGVSVAGASHDIVLADVKSLDNGRACPGHAAGFYVEADTSAVTLRRCEARGNTGSGFDTRGSALSILQSVAAANGNSGIRSSGQSRVENSLVAGNANFGIVSTDAGASLELANSTVADNGGGILLSGGSATIVNTIVSGSNKALELQEGVAIAEHHNIFYRSAPSSAHIVVKRGQETMASYNAHDINSGRWQAESGGGVATIAADPAFGNPPIGVYSLRPFSPAVDTGSAVDAPSIDIAGRARPLGVEVDRGAYERALSGGALYVVSPEGSDSADGSEANPWRSLTRALAEAGPADTVRVKAGVYGETVDIAFGGTAEDLLVIEGEPGARLASPDPTQSLVGITVRGTASDLEIRGLEVGGGFERGVRLEPGASRIVLADLAVHSNGEGIVIDGASDVALEGGTSSGNCTAGVRITGAASNVVVLGTVSEDSGVGCGQFGAGFIAGAEARGVAFRGAQAKGNSENGFDVKARPAMLFDIVAENNGNIGLRVEHDATAENVLLVGNGNVGAVVAASDSSGGSLSLVNATIAENTVGVLAGASTAGPVSLVLVNSILAGDGKLLEYQQSASLVAHHNLYYRMPRTASHIVRKDGGTTVERYDADAIDSGLWQAQSGQGTGDLAGDPRFIDPAQHLFWLRADSPAVDSGSAEEAPAADLLGHVRPLGAEVDRGAYERSGTGGGTYYVAVDGSDTNDGSAEAPYASLQRAADMAAPGDTIVLRPGAHTQPARIEAGGDATVPITIRAEAGALMDGSAVVASVPAISLASGVGFVVLQGLSVRGGWSAAVAAEAGSHDLTITGASISGAKRGISLGGALRVLVDSATLDDNCDAGIAIENGASDVTLRNLIGTRNGLRCGDLADAVFADASTARITVEDSSLQQNSEGGIDLRGSASRVARVVAYANGEAGIRVDDGQLENCLSYGNAATGIASIGRQGGAAVTIRNCTVHDNPVGVQLGEAVRNNALSATLANSIVSGAGTLLEMQQSVSLGEDYNLYFRANAFMPHIRVLDLRRTVASYNASDINSGVWTGASGQGAHSRSADPLFVDPTHALFELDEASLAVDFASSVGAPATDLGGKARPRGAGIDAGALEHVPCAEGGTLGCRPLPPPPPVGGTRVSFALQDVQVGTAPMGGALADFDRDGHLDLAVANSGEDTVHVLLGNGLGGFKGVTAYPVGVRPRGLAAGDLDGDGAPDIAVANQTSDDVYLLVGDGSGRFALAARLSANQAPVAATIADLDRDGRNDLVVVNMDSDDVSVFLNQGGANLGRPTNYRTGSGPLFVAVGDLNHDGNPDLAVANRKSDNLSVLLGDGTGSFGLPTHFPAGQANRSVAIADFDGDGHPDLVAASRLSNGASVLFGDGSGWFSAATSIPTGSTPNSVAAADLDGDGTDDFIVADTGDDRVSVVLSRPARVFSLPLALATGDHPSTVLTGDLDEDASLDLVTINREARSVTVLLGDGAGGVRSDSGEVAVGAGPVAIATGDIDRDGKLDGLIANAEGESLTLVKRVGGLSESASLPLPGARPRDVVLADLDGDGLLDAAVSDETGDRVALMRGDGVGLALTGFVAAGRQPAGLAAADLDRDGDIDLAVADRGSRRVTVLVNDGAGGFVPGQSVRVGSQPRALAVLDANLDGIPDLAVIHQESHALRFRLGNGDGTFRPWRSSSVAKMPTSLAVGDFDGDGLDDLAVGNSRFDFVNFLSSRGGRCFRRRKVQALAQPVGIATADFDRDGKLDIAVTSGKNGQVGVLLGSGDGNFALAATYAVGQGPNAVAAADLNGDEKPDLLVLNQDSATLSVLTNYSR